MTEFKLQQAEAEAAAALAAYTTAVNDPAVGAHEEHRLLEVYEKALDHLEDAREDARTE